MMRDPATSQRRRIVFDLSTAARWSGPPVGIVRVQRELARWARSNLSEVAFAFFDPVTMQYRALNGTYLDDFISGCASIDAWALPDPTGLRRRRSAWVPPALYAALQGRRTLLRVLERVRLQSSRASAARLADVAQRLIMSRRHRSAMIDAAGGRLDFVPADMALGDPVRFTADDVLVCTGNGWSHSNISEIALSKRAFGFRMVVLCHDTIPIQFPEFFRPQDIANTRHYWRRAFGLADLIIVASHAVARDARSFCAGEGIDAAAFAVCPPGSNPVTMRSDTGLELPAGLTPNHYALFVSTIEPRKGHALLCRAWERLLADGVPQAHDFKMVFVGRRGWLMDEFEQVLRGGSRTAQSPVVLSHVDDETLDLLYRRAAFCLYPSLYEGYGLPLVEAFARGKAVLASNGGSLPEVAGRFSPTLDPTDDDAWYDMMKQWIAEPHRRAPFEIAISEGFDHPNWDQAASRFFREIDGALSFVASPVSHV